MGYDNRQLSELQAVNNELVPEFLELFARWNAEYGSQERDLGERAEFVNLWRKAKKVKAIVWDGASDLSWREGLRTILFEIIGHCFLLLHDLDRRVEREINDQHERAFYGSRDARPKDGRNPGEEDLKVPQCGHLRCIEHLKVPPIALGKDELNVYQAERRMSDRDGVVPPGPKEIGAH